MNIRAIIAEGNNIKRYALAQLYDKDRNIQVTMESKEGKEVLHELKIQKPHVIILGDRLRDMTVFTLITKIMLMRPTPILIISDKDHRMIVDRPEALDYGIVDSIQMDMSRGKFIYPKELTERAKILSKIDLNKFAKQIEQINRKRSKKYELQEKLRQQLQLNKAKKKKVKSKSKTPRQKVIIMGASTGGPKMLMYILSQFPPTFPSIIVIQHLPRGFAEIFADRVKKSARMRVKIAKNGEFLRSGTIYIAPGGLHTELNQLSSGKVRIILTNGAPVNYVKPSIDVMLYSAVNIYGSNVISAILTGMGHDGRDGSRYVKNNGGKVFALNEQDSVVYGMNKAVIEAGIADQILSIDGIITAINAEFGLIKMENKDSK